MFIEHIVLTAGKISRTIDRVRLFVAQIKHLHLLSMELKATEKEPHTPSSCSQEVDVQKTYHDVPDGGWVAWTNVLAGHLVIFNCWGYITSYVLFIPFKSIAKPDNLLPFCPRIITLFSLGSGSFSLIMSTPWVNLLLMWHGLGPRRCFCSISLGFSQGEL